MVRWQFGWQFLARRPHLIGMQVDEIQRELEELWQAGSLPGRQAAEFNAVLRELWQELQRQQAVREPVRLRVIRS